MGALHMWFILMGGMPVQGCICNVIGDLYQVLGPKSRTKGGLDLPLRVNVNVTLPEGYRPAMLSGAMR